MSDARTILHKAHLPSSDAETDRMEDVEDRDSELERLAHSKSSGTEDTSIHTEEVKVEQSEESNKRRSSQEDDYNEQLKKRSKVEAENPSSDGKNIAGDEEGDSEVSEGDKNADEDVGKEKNEKQDNEREKNRIAAMQDLKGIEVLFAQLKDRLYSTQLQKLELELKLCEENKHPDLLQYLKMVDDDFQMKQQRLLNEQKYKLKCLDNQTRATRTAIHQQFMKDSQNLKAKEMTEITTDWYEINQERRTMDLQELELPEYYQYQSHLTPSNVKQYLPELVNKRNACYKEISELEALSKLKGMLPSALNYLSGCTNTEHEEDLKAMGLKS